VLAQSIVEYFAITSTATQLQSIEEAMVLTCARLLAADCHYGHTDIHTNR